MQGRLLLLFLACVTPLISFATGATKDCAAFLGFKEDSDVLWGFSFGFVWKSAWTVVALIFSYYTIYRQQYKPFRSFSDLRKATLEKLITPELEKLQRKIKDEVRVNIMRSRSIQIGHWLHIGKLVPVYHFGFQGSDLDRSLSFRFVRIFRWKWYRGVCGKAVATEEPQIVGIYGDPVEGYRLTTRMLGSTRNLKLVISYPIPQWRGKVKPELSYKIVGVINVDSRKQSTADAILEDETIRETFLTYLSESSSFIGLWL